VGWPLERIDRSGRALTFAVEGVGPWLLLPWCNINWLDFSDLGVLTREHTVILASPLGFAGSGRAESGAYELDDLVEDLVHVCRTIGAERFDVFGYSLTGALAASLACASDRVSSVMAGGFPLLGSYGAVRDDAERLVADPQFVAGISGTFDPEAVVAVYRGIAAGQDGHLVDRRRCRMAACWGADDTVLRSFDSSADLAGELTGRGVHVVRMDGLGHDTLLLHLDDVLRMASAWFRQPER
jgi:pimeloyl-ACP methyl ester carboxylesterase